MNAIEELLIPHKICIAQIATVVTVLQFLSGLFLLNDIRKKGNTNGFSTIPFLGSIVLTLLSVRFGAMLEDDAMIKVNFIGFALNVSYMCVYYFYTPGIKKTKVWAKIGLSGLLCIAGIVYCEYEEPNLLEFRFGMIITLVLLLLVGSPLLNLEEVIRTKCTKSLPLPIIVSGTIVSLSWLLYGIAIRNTVILVQNLILIGLSAIQLSFFFIYPARPIQKSKKNKSKVQ